MFVFSQWPGFELTSDAQCNHLTHAFGGLVSFSNSTVYISEQTGPKTGYFNSAEQNVMPACRVTPTSTQDVTGIVTSHASLDCQFAIRGGGHMLWSGSANIQDGVTVDLSQMKDVSISTDRKIVSAGPGCRWGDLYSKWDPLGLAVVGGRVNTVGIAGLTIGGT